MAGEDLDLLTRVYSGRIKEVHQVRFGPNVTEVTYSHPLLEVRDSFVQFEPLASQPMIASRSGRNMTISKTPTSATEVVRLVILLPDQVVD